MVDYSTKDFRRYHVCNCVGPRNGEPLCPCRMRGVTIQDGRYIEVVDHGPVSNGGAVTFVPKEYRWTED